MAKVHYNVVMHGTSGKVGDLLVFRQRGGKTIIAKIPARSKNGLTPEQLAINEKFKAASAYARTALKDPSIKAVYQAKAGPNQSAYNLAIADFFNTPEVQEVEISNYTGLPGSVIRIAAFDEGRVKAVRVTIAGASGNVIEQGEALLDTDTGYWLYRATQTNSTLTGSRIVVTAVDLPGNETTQETELS